jgi:type IV pilus assembly protein PilP
MITTSTIRVFLTLLALALVLSSCGNREKKYELQLYIQNLKDAASTNEKKPLPIEFQLPMPVKYQSEQAHTGAGSNNAGGVIAKPIQSYSLKELSFVGTITQDNQTWAYILTPDNMIYGAKQGDIIGNSYGKIVKITADHIEIMEQHIESGKPVQSIVTMQLKE